MLVNLSFLFSKPTGIANYTRNLYPHLKPLDPILLSAEEIPGYDCYSIPRNLTPEYGTRGHILRLLWTQFRVPSIYRQLRSRLLFSPVPEAPLYSQCRFAIMVHDLIPLRFPNRKSRLNYYYQYVLPKVVNQSRYIICNSVATANDLIDFCDISASKITPIPLAYDRQHFRPLELIPRRGRPYFLYLGRQDPYKNIERLLTAFASLPDCKEYELWLAGPTDERYTPRWQELARALDVREEVKFMEYVPYEKLPTLLNGAIALVFPSLWEGFGIPLLEAMACGTPVITSNISSLPEVTGEAALLVDPYSVEEIAIAMNTMVTDIALRENLSELGLLRASEFSWSKTGEKTVEVLQQFL